MLTSGLTASVRDTPLAARDGALDIGRILALYSFGIVSRSAPWSCSLFGAAKRLECVFRLQQQPAYFVLQYEAAKVSDRTAARASRSEN